MKWLSRINQQFDFSKEIKDAYRDYFRECGYKVPPAEAVLTSTNEEKQINFTTEKRTFWKRVTSIFSVQEKAPDPTPATKFDIENIRLSAK
jgi:3-phenylpropionate/cinnamic acid dioxygenase small subunit